MTLPSPAPRPAPQFLMCRPTFYRIAYEINPWMSLRRQARSQRALAQWERLYHLLTRTLRVRVRLLSPRRGVPDLVFTANAGLVQGRMLIRSNFRYPQRQREEPIIEAYFKRCGYRVVRLPRRYTFEGEGDALWMGETLLFGFRFRSEAPTHALLSQLLGTRVLPLELADPRFYHLDTCWCPLDGQTALWFPRAFDRYGRRVIESVVTDPVCVSAAEAKRFVCNAIVVPAPATGSGGSRGRAVVMPEGASTRLRRQLARRGFDVYPVDLSEFLKAGGAAKCLVLRLTGKPVARFAG